MALLLLEYPAVISGPAVVYLSPECRKVKIKKEVSSKEPAYQDFQLFISIVQINDLINSFFFIFRHKNEILRLWSRNEGNVLMLGRSTQLPNKSTASIDKSIDSPADYNSKVLCCYVMLFTSDETAVFVWVTMCIHYGGLFSNSPMMDEEQVYLILLNHFIL